MIVTPTNVVQSRRIVEQHGLLIGEAVIGANAVGNFLASVRDAVPKRSDAVGRMAAVRGHRLPT